MTTDKHILYHLRDPARSCGFGYDGYIGTTNDAKRRFKEHMKAASQGKHPNPKVQKLYDDAGGKLQMFIVSQKTKEQVLASEALLVNRENKYANIQRGGGHMRGLDQGELIRLSGIGSKDNAPSPWKPASGSISKQHLALIMAAGIAAAGGLFLAYFRKSKTKIAGAEQNQPTTANEVGFQPSQEAPQLSDLERRRTIVDRIHKQTTIDNRRFFESLAGDFALALALKTLKRE